MIEERIGKIDKATFGRGGYDDAMIGLSLSFAGDGWGTGTFVGTWAHDPPAHAKWTTEDQDKQFAMAVRKLEETLSDAKKTSCDQLVGVPVMVTFENDALKSWRVLTEAIL